MGAINCVNVVDYRRRLKDADVNVSDHKGDKTNRPNEGANLLNRKQKTTVLSST